MNNYFDNKLVVVTGASGFVGTHFVDALIRRNARVRAVVRQRKMNVQNEGLEIVTADLTRQEDCLRVMEGVDYVIHAAGAVSAAATTSDNPMNAITINLVLAAQVLQAAWTQKVKRFLLFSSSTGYPAADHPIKEEEMWTGPTYPGYFGYGWMRRYLERLGEFVASKSSVQIALVRPTAIYGPWDNFDPVTSHVFPALIRKAVERMDPYEVWGTGEEVRDVLHVTDLVRGSLLLLEKYAVCDPVNIGSGQAIKIKNIVRVILKAADYDDARVVYNTSKPSTIPVRMVDITKCRRLLGFEPQIELHDGMRATVAWYRAHVHNQ